MKRYMIYIYNFYNRLFFKLHLHLHFTVEHNFLFLFENVQITVDECLNTECEENPV